MTESVNSNDVSFIDFSKIIGTTLSAKDEHVTRLADELKDALSNNKLIYLMNVGFSDEELTKMYSISKQFFALPPEVKERYRITSNYDYNGYLPIGSESINKGILVEYYESFNVVGSGREFPKEVPEFSECVEKLSEKFLKLTEAVLFLMAISLNLEPDFFLRCHQYIMQDHNKNTSIFRTLFYPPVQEEPHPGIVRLFQHTDFGSFTFLMQDSEGGLQVRSGSGEWINVKCVPGAAVMVVADIIEIWTSGKYKGTTHRVTIPEKKEIRTRSRYSLAFFVQPDFDIVLKPLNPSPGEEGKEIIAGEYIASRIHDYTFK